MRVGNSHVGWSSRVFLDELTPHLLKGRAVELVQLRDDKTLVESNVNSRLGSTRSLLILSRSLLLIYCE